MLRLLYGIVLLMGEYMLGGLEKSSRLGLEFTQALIRNSQLLQDNSQRCSCAD